MAYRYIPDRFVEEIDATLNKLKSYELLGTNVQEERTKKKKKQKEIKKKEERTNLLTRKALENSSEDSKAPTLEEVRQFLEEEKITQYTAEDFFNAYDAIGWVDKAGNPIKKWKSLAKRWTAYQQRINVIPKEYAKRQTDSANASGTQTNRGNAGEQAPVKARHEQLQEILQEEHFVLASVGAELEGVVAASMAGNKANDGKHGVLPGSVVADNRLSTLAADFGPHAVIVWLSKAFEAALVRLEVPEEQFTARQVVQVAEGLLRVLDVYKGLTARQVLRAMERIERVEKGDDIMAALYEETTRQRVDKL